MADNPDITRLTELLIGRQDHQQQQIDRLIDGAARTTDLLARQQQQTDLLLAKIDKADAIAETFGQVQSQLIDQLELIYNEQQRFNQRQESFNDRQEKFNERQDQFNIIFLDEIRGLKKDVKMLIEVVMQRHEERLKRLEDFMDGFLRKAG